jgi:hypothetical protein
VQKATEKHSKWNTDLTQLQEILSSQTNISATFKRQGEERPEKLKKQ